MLRRGLWSFKVTVLLVSISILISACNAPALPSNTPTPTPTADDELFISAQIQNTLNDYNTALEKNDKKLFMTTVYQGHQTLTEAFSMSFDYMEDSGYVKTVKLGMTVIAVEPKGQGLVLAHIQRNRDGWRLDLPFRRTADRWVISEPFAVEAGAPQSTVSGNYTFITFPFAEDVNQKIIPLLTKAQDHVLKDMGQVPAGKVEITIYPAASISPVGCSPSGWNISKTAGSADSIYIISPESFCSNFYDLQKGWEPDIEMLLTHELARIAYVRNFENPGQGADWFFEGMAEYVAGYDEMPDVIAAVQNDAILPIIDTSSADQKNDLAHFANLGYPSAAYGLSESLVTFIVEKYGGMDTFWALARSFDKTQDMKTAIKDTLAINYEEFDTAWRTWLKEEYIKR